MWKPNFHFRRPHGLMGLFIIWLGQMVSGIASNTTTVALPIWIFNITGSGAAVGLLEFFFFSSYLLVVLFVGVLIDRYSRKMMMLVYDFTSLSAVAILLVLQTSGILQVWHLYVAAVVQGAGFAFQAPSYAAAITTMMGKKEYVRANGLMSLLYDVPEIFGPLLAGTLYLDHRLGRNPGPESAGVCGFHWCFAFCGGPDNASYAGRGMWLLISS